MSILDKIDTATPIASVGTKLNELALAKIEDNKGRVTVLGTAKVRRLGIGYWQDKQRKTHWVTPTSNTPLGVREGQIDANKMLLGLGFSNFDPEYQVDLQIENHNYTLNLGEYHTRNIFGSAPTLTLDEVVEVSATKGEKGKPVYGYRPLKKVS